MSPSSDPLANESNDKLIWLSKNADSIDAVRLAEEQLRKRPNEVRRCWKCQRYFGIHCFDMNVDGSRKTHCFKCNGKWVQR